MQVHPSSVSQEVPAVGNGEEDEAAKMILDAEELTAISGAVVPLPVDLVSVAVHLGAAPEALGVLLGARLKVLALVGEGEHAGQPSVRSATSGYRG